MKEKIVALIVNNTVNNPAEIPDGCPPKRSNANDEIHLLFRSLVAADKVRLM